MSSFNLTLQAFVESVPTVINHATLGTAVNLFSPRHSRIVVVNDSFVPVGILHLTTLTPYLIHTGHTSLDWEQSLTNSPLLHPLGLLPNHLQLHQLWPHLQRTSPSYYSQPKPDWAIVTEEKKFLGLLDQQRLLEYIVSDWPLSLTKIASIEQENQEDSSQSREQEALQKLINLFEQLPLPLSLETSNGDVIVQNQAWIKQFPPGHPPQDTAPANQLTELQTINNTRENAWGLCSLPTDSEKVWQFVRMPLPASEQLKLEKVSLVLAQDVTEYQQVAKELTAKNADLVQLNRLKDDFLACISHELKTPLTAVLGLSTLLKEKSSGQLNERQTRYAQLIHQSGRHLMAVVNDILDLTRMESGQMELSIEPVLIAQVCEQAVHTAVNSLTHHHPNSSQEDIRGLPPGFVLEVAPELDIIMADELRLRQMLVNLLSNALKFTLHDESCESEPPTSVRLTVSCWEGWVAFTVSDTGIGIPDDKQHLIFQKFQQLENPLTRRFEGVGLGLVVARGLARLHGGDITFLSQEGKGSEFTLLLPPSPPRPTTASLPGNPRHQLVLIVEAVPKFIEELTEQLTALGYRVVIARTGTEALDKARRFSPRVIFLNPLLPMLSGWDVLTLLKSDSLTCQIPTIITATKAEREQAHQNKAEGFLTLPVSGEALRNLLSKYSSLEPKIPEKLTILRFNINPSVSETGEALNALLHQYDYRVIEADDLEGAELLARVWQPDVVLLDTSAGLTEGSWFFEQLSQCTQLAALPLVTVDSQTTEKAMQVPGLRVYPCLPKAGVQPKHYREDLLSVFQQASGKNGKPVVCLVDLAALSDLGIETLEHRNDWCQALLQYIQTAGYGGMIGHLWADVYQQLENQSVDLLLINFRPSNLKGPVLDALESLQNLTEKPPILVVVQQSNEGLFTEPESSYRSGKYQSLTNTSVLSLPQQIEQLLQQIAGQILPGSLSMAELLEEINRSLAERSL